MLSFLAARAIPGVEIVSGNIYKRTIAIGDLSGVISVAPADKNRVNVSVRFPNMAALPQIIARVRRAVSHPPDPDNPGPPPSPPPAAATPRCPPPPPRRPRAPDPADPPPPPH